MKKGIIGAMSMMAMSAGIAAQSTANFADAANEIHSTQPRSGKLFAIAKEVRASETIRNQKSYGSPSFSNAGIPPKVYGMHYVKKGTHKRTNI